MSRKSKTVELCYIAISAILICICAWITIPGPIPFTMQTFGVFVVLQLLGWKNGLFTILLYILLGLMGLPVFSNFAAGPGVLYSATGGFIIGFIPCAFAYGIITSVFKKNKYSAIIASAVGLIVCYLCGTVWYAHLLGSMNLLPKAFYICVVPFIIPDIIKLVIARAVSAAVKKHII